MDVYTHACEDMSLYNRYKINLYLCTKRTITLFWINHKCLKVIGDYHICIHTYINICIYIYIYAHQ